MYRITGYAYCIWLSFGDAHPLVHLVLHMARDLFAGHVLVFVFCFLFVSIVLTSPSCYLIIGSVAPLVVPRYPPHLLPIYSPCPVPVRRHGFSGCVLILPCLFLPSFLLHGVVFVACFGFINKIPYSALLSPCLIQHS